MNEELKAAIRCVRYIVGDAYNAVWQEYHARMIVQHLRMAREIDSAKASTEKGD